MLRAQQQFITQDLAQKMVFLTGPRQVGKTYLAQEIAKGFQKSVYLNYDYFEDRDIIKNTGKDKNSLFKAKKLRLLMLGDD